MKKKKNKIIFRTKNKINKLRNETVQVLVHLLTNTLIQSVSALV